LAPPQYCHRSDPDQEERARSDALARDLEAAQSKIEALTAVAKAGETAQTKQAVERSAAGLQKELQEERYKADKLASDLAPARHELEMQTTRMAETGDKTAHNGELAELRQALPQAQSAAAADKASLAQERNRNQELAQQLAAGRDVTPDLGHNATAPPSEPGPAPVMASDAARSVPKPDKPMAVAAKPATGVPRPTAPEMAGPEAARLMARASLLLSQGNVGAARMVLERVAETGNASALFALAETYDPLVLSAWRPSAPKAMSRRNGNSMARRLQAAFRRRRID
jgi:hypothetical protein